MNMQDDAKVTIDKLPEIARSIRRGIIESVHSAGSGHLAGALGLADMLAYLYFAEMNIDPKDPTKEDRDRFVLSPAHMVPGLYATLAERGFFPKSELSTLRQFGSRLQGHTFRNLDIGVETTGGSLGQGLSIAIGFALVSQRETSAYRTYCVVSDGELDEGQTWEAFMYAAKEKLDSLCIILDRNEIQQSDDTRDVMPTEPIAHKLEAFNLHVLEIDGHDFGQISFAMQKASLSKGKATVILSHTIAGKGVSFMEGKWQWHSKSLSDEEYKQAIKELS